MEEGLLNVKWSCVAKWAPTLGVELGRLVSHWTDVVTLKPAKRALVSLIKAMAVQYHVIVMLNRDSPDAEVTRAFKKVALKAHPDKGGSTEDFRKLNEARESWEDCRAV